MNTYIIRVSNKDGYEWVDYNGETVIVTAPTLEEALGSLYWFESVEECLFNDFLDARPGRSEPTLKDTLKNALPLEFQVTEIPAAGCLIEGALVKTILGNKLSQIFSQVKADADEVKKAEAEKKTKIDLLRIEANKLGISLEDLMDAK